MRLTLHWLLAYLHNVLSPTDSEAMERKIQDSDLASGLIQRIETIERKLRMNAPKVDAKGLAADANNVADYLDSTLPGDRVSDFERVCLDSDMHLAEVASCHRILAMILGKPADISDSLRQRMYAVGQVASIVKKSLGQNGKTEKAALQRGSDDTLTSTASHSPLDGASAYTAGTEDVAVPAMKKGAVPDYLKTKPSASIWPAMMGLAIGLLLLIGGLRIFGGPFGPDHPIFGRFLGGGKPTVASAPEESSEGTTTEGDKPASTSKDAESSDTPAEPTEPSKEAASSDEKEKEAAATKTSDDEVSTTKEKEPAATTEKPPVPDDGAKETTKEEMPADETPVAPLPPGKKPGNPAVKPAVEAVVAARYLSDNQALARFVPAKQQWLKVPQRDLLLAGNRFAVLPTFRPQITLPSAVSITFLGESQFQFIANEGMPTARLRVPFGRFQVVTQGSAEGSVEVELAGLRGMINITDPGATLAVEVKPVLVPGVRLTPASKSEAVPPAAIAPTDSDAPLPDPTIPLFAIELSALGGRVSWTPSGSVAIEIQPGNAVTYVGGEGGEQSGPFMPPEWMDPRASGLFDAETSLQLEDRLPDDRSLQISLEELLSDRRVEIRALAALSLSAIGHFDHLIKEFSDARQYSYWSSEVDALRRGLATGDKDRATILALMHDLGPSRGSDILQMLEGYNAMQLTSGSAKILVESLEHSELDMRVLAFENLRRITGATFQYRPEKKLDLNKKPIARWRERLKEGGIVYAAEPRALSPRKPATK